MKKTMRILAALLCVLLLSGCTMPSDISQMIYSIGPVTLDSGAAIKAAEEGYELLFPLLRERVDNYSTLVEARNIYSRMTAANEAMFAAADAVGEVTTDSKDALAQLRKTYEANTEEYAPEEFSDFLTRLEEMEKQYRQCVLDGMYQEAEALYDQHQYALAISVLENMMKEADADTYGDRCKALTEKCELAIAQSAQDEAKALLEAGDPRGALNKLDNLDPEYRKLGDYATVRESALAELTKRRPENGKVLERTAGTGSNVFHVTSQLEQDCCIKLESTSNAQNYILVYIRAGKTASIKAPNGTFYIKQVTGEYWCDTDSYFYPTNSYTKFNQKASFSSTSTSYTKVTVTLGGVLNGNMGGDSISGDAF